MGPEMRDLGPEIGRNLSVWHTRRSGVDEFGPDQAGIASIRAHVHVGRSNARATDAVGAGEVRVVVPRPGLEPG